MSVPSAAPPGGRLTPPAARLQLAGPAPLALPVPSPQGPDQPQLTVVTVAPVCPTPVAPQRTVSVGAMERLAVLLALCAGVTVFALAPWWLAAALTVVAIGCVPRSWRAR